MPDTELNLPVQSDVHPGPHIYTFCFVYYVLLYLPVTELNLPVQSDVHPGPYVLQQSTLSDMSFNT